MTERRKQLTPGNRPRLRIMVLTGGLFLVAIATAVFSITTVQIQSATTAYAGGESAWSRGQVATVHYLNVYAETGDTAALERARQWLALPLGDRRAREAMETAPIDYPTAQEGLLAGANHPDDIPRMIWLYRYFSHAPYFREAVRVWQESDPYLDKLVSIADLLESTWASNSPASAEARRQLRQQLNEVDQTLSVMANEFREATGAAARWLSQLLSIVSVVFLFTLGLFTALLVWRLTRVITESEENFRTVFQQTAMGMAQLDQQSRLLDVNQALCELLKQPREKLLKLSYRDLVIAEDWEIGLEERERMLQGEQDSYSVEQRLRRGDGKTVWARMTLSRIVRTNDRRLRYVLALEDVSESRRLSVKLNYQATHDELTGLLNRRAFGRHLAEFLRRARNDDSEHVLCFIDLDQFKIVNDTAGHQAGDQLLRQIAKLLQANIRDRDLLARLGGDEFAIILENCKLETAQELAEKLRGLLEGLHFSWNELRFQIGCSIGVSPILSSSADTSSLLRSADMACYMAKESGRNRVYTLQENDQDLAQQRGEMQWLGRIRSALDENRLFLDAQRFECFRDPHNLRYEVLVRLINEEGAVVAPGAFLPASERFGVIHQIDRWVIATVCRKLASHPEHLAVLDACHINLSARSFEQPDFADYVLGTMKQHGIPPSKLCFEITETAAIRNLVDITGFMDRLSEEGCTFALDDFGAGFSSFGYLRNLQVHCLKIDGVFVRDIVTDETDLAMVRAINEIGQTLGKTIIAEFVESSEAAEQLRAMGVHYAQGNYIHYPCRFTEILTDPTINQSRLY
ncbi:MAG: EAL domain-containing protein [Halomonadaceae bacterium]|nr:MAG: EAL domain-containing protein [Halomonadaceae bacterium]